MPPASSNESQGLKIAVAVLVTLTVFLSVTSYFLYSNYSQTSEKLTKSESDLQTAKKAQSDAVNQYDDMRKRIGPKVDEYDPARAEIDAEQKKINDEIAGLIGQSNAALGKLQAAGATGPELEDARTKVQQISAAYLGEPNKTFLSSLSRLKELLQTMVMLDAEISRDYAALKRNLESTNAVNKSQLDVQTKGFGDAKADLQKEHDAHIQARDQLLTKVDQYQTEIQRQATEIQTLNNKIRQMEEDSSKKLTQALTELREKRDQLERKETVLDRPDGYITYVDPRTGEVRIGLSRGQGVHPQMKFTIFDKSSPGIPTEKPKGTIELTEVNDRFSVARITRTMSPSNPLRVGDIVYSPAFSPNEPMRFALVGKLDVNRDGRDDRADLRRMVESAGGIVDYDLPPPEAGKESGQLTGRDSWYVYDDPNERPPFVLEYKTGNEGTTNEQEDFLKKQTEAIREARLLGVRPMPIGRLLNYLGYDYHAPVRGRAEGVNADAMHRLLAPRQRDQAKPAEGAAPATPTENGNAPAPDAGALPAPGDAPANP